MGERLSPRRAHLCQDANKHWLPWRRAPAWSRDISRGEAARHGSTAILLRALTQREQPSGLAAVAMSKDSHCRAGVLTAGTRGRLHSRQAWLRARSHLHEFGHMCACAHKCEEVFPDYTHICVSCPTGDAATAGELSSAAGEDQGALGPAHAVPPLPLSIRSLVPCQLVGYVQM